MTVLSQLFDPTVLQAMALTCAAAAVLVLALAVTVQLRRQQRARSTVDTVLARRDSALAGEVTTPASPSLLGRWLDAASRSGRRWLEGKWGESLLPDEERQALDVCGYRDIPRARALYAFVRVALPVVLPLLGWLAWAAWGARGGALGFVLVAFAGFAIGWMLPKWFILRRMAGRRREVEEELPLLVDLLRLLQGVGLSIDQSLHVIISDFRNVLPVLGFELSVAVERHARGVTRAQSLARMSQGFANDDLAAIARLIVQVDEQGGAVQEPLRQFGERLREQRRMQFKERVGKLTVKMTGVMVLTLLPALLIVTAGAGFLALFRGLARVMGA